MDLAGPHGLAVRTPAFHAGDHRFESGWGYSQTPWKSRSFARRAVCVIRLRAGSRGRFGPFRRCDSRVYIRGEGHDAEQPADLGPEPVSVGSPHDMGVDGEGDSRINVSHLCLDIGKVVAGGDHVRDVGAAEGVGGDMRADRRSFLRGPNLVRSGEHGRDPRRRTLSLFRRLPVRVGKAGASPTTGGR